MQKQHLPIVFTLSRARAFAMSDLESGKKLDSIWAKTSLAGLNCFFSPTRSAYEGSNLDTHTHSTWADFRPVWL